MCCGDGAPILTTTPALRFEPLKGDESMRNATEKSTTAATTITEHEAQQVERANATNAQPVVFVHGLWLLPSSWDRWAKVFEDAGYTALTPGWPDDPETVDAANANPEVFAHKPLARSRTTSTKSSPA